MSLSRRDFIKLFGVSLGSLLLVRCQQSNPPTPTETTEIWSCYESPLETPTSTPASINLPARDILIVCWMSFDKLAETTFSGSTPNPSGGSFSQELVSRHRSALDQLAAEGELTAPVADLVQEAYEAAVYHVWRSNASITCYAPVNVDYYGRPSASVLVAQAQVLDAIASQRNVNPATLEKARAALEHDMAFYALSEADMQALYDTLWEESRQTGQPIPPFEELELQVGPEARQAAEFLVKLLSEK